MKVGSSAHRISLSLPLPINQSKDLDEKVNKQKRLISSQDEPSSKRVKESRPGIYDAEGRLLLGKIRHSWESVNYYGEFEQRYIDLNGKFAYTTQENRLSPEEQKSLTLFTGLYFNSATGIREEGTFLIVELEDDNLSVTKLSSTVLSEKDFSHFRSIVDESGIRKTGLFNDDKLRWGLLEHPTRCNKVGSFDDQERLSVGEWHYSFQDTYGFKLTGTFTYTTEDNKTVTTFQGEKIHRHSEYSEKGSFTIEEQFLVYCRLKPVIIDPMEALTQEMRLDPETKDVREGQFHANGRLKSGKIIYKTNRIYEGEFGPTERLIFGKRYYPTPEGDRHLEGSYSYVREGYPTKTICYAEGTQTLHHQSAQTILMEGIFKDTLMLAGKQLYADGTLVEGVFENGHRLQLTLPGEAPIECYYQKRSLYSIPPVDENIEIEPIFKIRK